MIFPLGAKKKKKAFDKVQHPFAIKTLNNLGIKEDFLNLIKGISEKSTANIVFNGERLDAFSLRPETRQGYTTSPLLFNIELDILTRVIRQEK